MNEHDKQMTGAEILSIISGMINHAKTRFSETGQLYVLRGFVTYCSFHLQFRGMDNSRVYFKSKI